MVRLICKKVRFFSECDELAFHEWIIKIKAVTWWEGVGDEIHLNVPKSTISQKGLRELVALFYRYDIDMSQLEQFANDQNRRWFADDGNFWHEKVFHSNKF